MFLFYLLRTLVQEKFLKQKSVYRISLNIVRGHQVNQQFQKSKNLNNVPFLCTNLFQKRGHYSRGDIIQGRTLIKEIRYVIYGRPFLPNSTVKEVCLDTRQILLMFISAKLLFCIIEHGLYRLLAQNLVMPYHLLLLSLSRLNGCFWQLYDKFWLLIRLIHSYFAHCSLVAEDTKIWRGSGVGKSNNMRVFQKEGISSYQGQKLRGRGQRPHQNP